MSKRALLTLAFALLPSLALAEPGSGTDRDGVNREIEIMQRDGRWGRPIAEGRALYSGGYYYEAKRKGLLRELRTGASAPASANVAPRTSSWLSSILTSAAPR